MTRLLLSARLAAVTISLVLLAASPAGAQDCPQPNYVLSSQAQVNAFPSTCSTVTGSLIIQGIDINDLTPLGAITSVGWNLSIGGNAALTTLDGLGAITSVGGTLSIGGNAALTTLDGLGAITSVGGTLSIGGNAALTTLDGLGAITSVRGNLVIQSNAALTTLDGLGAITSVGGTLFIGGNAALTTLDGLGAITSVGGTLTIQSNAALTTLDGLGAITSVGGTLTIQSNAALTTLDGLGAIASVGGTLTIQSNAALTTLDGLGAITSVGGLSIQSNAALTTLDGLGAITSVGGLSVFNNAALTTLDGLGAITSVGVSLAIGGNAALTTLDGLGAITSVGGTLSIGGNAALTTLDGLGALTSVGGGLFILSNATLAECAAGLDGLISGDPPAFTGARTVFIRGNAPGGRCNSPQQVLDASESEPEPVACTTDAPLSFDFDGTGGPAGVSADDFDSIDGGDGEFAGLRNESSDDSIALAGCSFVSFDPFTEKVTFAAEATATAVVDPDGTYVFATTGGDQPFGQADVLADSPGAFALVVGPAAEGDDVLSFVTPVRRIVAAVVYDLTRDPDLVASIGGNATQEELAEFAAALGSAFGGATAGEASPSAALGLAVWPNPSAGRARVAFGLAEAGEARVAVYDALGREVVVVAEGSFGPGRHEAAVDASALPAGVYVVRSTSASGVQAARLTVAR